MLLLVLVAGCAVEQGKVYVKDGKRYGVTASKIWRDRWWNFYERGSSYAAGGFWDEAISDFQAAIRQRDDDQRRARTYGLHFADYFPHRELGIIYYRTKRHVQAIRELETSLGTVESAKAKFYLNKARAFDLQQSGRDTAPPSITLTTPVDGALTNRFTVTVTGRAEDDTYVASITVNGRPRFIELAEPRLPLHREIALRDGSNAITIVATDLMGRQARKRITVHLDRHGPLVSLDSFELRGTPPTQHVRLEGAVVDRSGVSRFTLAGKTVPLGAGTEWQFRQQVPVASGTRSVPFEVRDKAGNITRGEITLVPPAPQPVREGKPATHLLPRWAVLHAGTVLTDLPTYHTAAADVLARRDRHAPVIKLHGLTDRVTIYDGALYLEGQVSDASAIVAFSVNGESLWRRQAVQLFFGQNVQLQPGENRFVFEAVDEAGNIARRTLVVRREIRRVKQVGSRLRVSLLPFAKRGAASVLSDAVYDNLFNVLVNQGRFDLVERQQLDSALRELRLSQTDLVEEESAVKTGKIMAAEGMLFGSVTETPRSLEVLARFIDVETSLVLAAVDVYGEELTLPNLQTLMEGMAWKLRRHFPLVEGLVLDTTGKVLWTDLRKEHGIKRYMKLIVYRAGEEVQHSGTGRLLHKPEVILGEARITAVSDNLSEATLLSSQRAGNVHESDKVITK